MKKNNIALVYKGIMYFFLIITSYYDESFILILWKRWMFICMD